MTFYIILIFIFRELELYFCSFLIIFVFQLKIGKCVRKSDFKGTEKSQHKSKSWKSEEARIVVVSKNLALKLTKSQVQVT